MDWTKLLIEIPKTIITLLAIVVVIITSGNYLTLPNGKLLFDKKKLKGLELYMNQCLAGVGCYVIVFLCSSPWTNSIIEFFFKGGIRNFYHDFIWLLFFRY